MTKGLKTSTLSTEEALLQARKRSLLQRQPYSLQLAGILDGVHVVNNSAATTPQGVAESLSAFEKPVIWIAESHEVQPAYAHLGRLIGSKVKALVGVGSHAAEMHRTLWRDVHYFIAAHSWDEALDMALIVAATDESVLFAPGCAAVEPFDSYLERGAFFQSLVNTRAS